MVFRTATVVFAINSWLATLTGLAIFVPNLLFGLLVMKPSFAPWKKEPWEQE